MSHSLHGYSNGYDMYAYSSFHGPSPHGMPCSYGPYGYTSMSQGTYGYNGHDMYGTMKAANVSEKAESVAEQLEFHLIWSQMNMLDDVKRWMTPDGTAYGNARAEYWRSWNALGLRLKKAAESKRYQPGLYQHKPAQSSGAQGLYQHKPAQSSGAQSSGVNMIKPAVGGSKLRPEEVLYQIQPGCSAPQATHMPATTLRQNTKVG